MFLSDSYVYYITNWLQYCFPFQQSETSVMLPICCITQPISVVTSTIFQLPVGLNIIQPYCIWCQKLTKLTT